MNNVINDFVSVRDLFRFFWVHEVLMEHHLKSKLKWFPVVGARNNAHEKSGHEQLFTSLFKELCLHFLLFPQAYWVFFYSLAKQIILIPSMSNL